MKLPRYLLLPAAAACAVLLVQPLLRAEARKIELPPDTEIFEPGPGSEIANAHCLTCHSVDYIKTQPPMPRAFWQATVEKMEKKFGAAAPTPAQTEYLLNYLVSHYGRNPAQSPAPGKK